jgi:hypothetical protein
MKDFTELMRCVFETVQNEAKNHVAYNKDGGIIQVSLVPRSKEADAWLGGLSTFGKREHVGFGCVTIEGADIVTYSFARAINRGTSLGTILNFSTGLSKTIDVEIAENRDGTSLAFMRVRVCVCGSKNVRDDTVLANTAIEAISNWFESPYEVVPMI